MMDIYQIVILNSVSSEYEPINNLVYKDKDIAEQVLNDYLKNCRGGIVDNFYSGRVNKLFLAW